MSGDRFSKEHWYKNWPHWPNPPEYLAGMEMNGLREEEETFTGAGSDAACGGQGLTPEVVAES